MNRRDFLRPTQLSTSAGQILGAVSECKSAAQEIAAAANTEGKEFALLRFSRQAMATTFEVMLPLGTSQALAAAEEALDEIDRLEIQLSVYSEHSEVSRLNRNAPYAAVPVEKELFGLLATAARITSESEGAFDITAGALIKAWGFFRPPRRVPSEEQIKQALQRVGLVHLVFDIHRRTVRFLRPGLEINLGSIGKGYALDRAAALLHRRGNIPAALLHGGHSSLYAIGTEPGNQNGWAVGISHPWKPEQCVARVRLRNSALGTSAATFQHLESHGRKLGHILDPRTGWPAEGMAMASVMAPNATEADALATAFFILGIEKAQAYCQTHPDVGVILLPEGDKSRPVFLGRAKQYAEESLD
jgi:thiamine biosynthesis lipoprotein